MTRCDHPKQEHTPAANGKVNQLCLICGAVKHPEWSEWREANYKICPVYPHLIERYWPSKREEKS